jgi:hypothetical protein
MKYIKTEFGEYNLFDTPLNTWNGEIVYKEQKEELNKQINKLLSIQGALGQSSQGEKEDWDSRKKLESEAKLLGKSIEKALDIK